MFFVEDYIFLIFIIVAALGVFFIIKGKKLSKVEINEEEAYNTAINKVQRLKKIRKILTIVIIAITIASPLLLKLNVDLADNYRVKYNQTHIDNKIIGISNLAVNTYLINLLTTLICIFILVSYERVYVNKKIKEEKDLTDNEKIVLKKYFCKNALSITGYIAILLVVRIVFVMRNFM